MPRRLACRCGTSGRACRRSRTCSPRRSANRRSRAAGWRPAPAAWSGRSRMPIHDQSYRRYGGGKTSPGGAWQVIAVAGIRTMLRKRAFLGVLLFAWGPFIARAIQIYVTANYAQVASAFGVNAQTFRDFLGQQDFFVFIVTIYVGAGLIANDRRANALQIYLSKPLLRTEYIVGKAAVLFTFLLLVTWMPGILLLLLEVAFKGSFEFVRANLFLFPAITV